MLFIDATIPEVVLIILTSVVGIFALSAALEGYMFRNLKIYEIIPLIVGGLLMIYPGVITDIIGVAIVAAIIVIQIIETRISKKKA